MTGVELIVAALAAGAAAGLTEATSGAIRDAYVGLRDAVRRRLAGSSAGPASTISARLRPWLVRSPTRTIRHKHWPPWLRGLIQHPLNTFLR